MLNRRRPSCRISQRGGRPIGRSAVWPAPTSGPRDGRVFVECGCGLRPAFAAGRDTRGLWSLRGALMEDCTWERRISPNHAPVFLMILRFLHIRQDGLTCSHVHRPPCVHMGARQPALTIRAEPRNLNENRPPPRRTASLPCASRLHGPPAGRGPYLAGRSEGCRAGRPSAPGRRHRMHGRVLTARAGASGPRAGRSWRRRRRRPRAALRPGPAAGPEA